MADDNDHEFMHNVDDAVGGDIVRESMSRGISVEEVDPRVWFVRVEYVNMVVFETSDGLVLVDSGSRDQAERVHRVVREVTSAPVHTVVLTHGHQDHAFGLGPWMDEPTPRPRIIAHRNTPARYRRYSRTEGYNEHLNRVQFGVTSPNAWPKDHADFFWPDTLYDERLTIRVGDEVFHLRHGKGHTDDATYVWVPARKIVCAGDFWEGMMPDCGSPQRTQRYAEGWADAAEEIAALGAELLLPGHGEPIEGADAIVGCMLDIAQFLRHVVAQTLDGLNRGLTHEEIVASVTIPPDLADRPYMQPRYDHPQFIARNIIRMYGGWWDGHSANVMPAPAASRAQAVVDLAGGVDALAARARAVAESDLALACHLAEWAMLAEPDSVVANECARDVFRQRQGAESSLHVRAMCGYAIRRAEAALAAQPAAR